LEPKSAKILSVKQFFGPKSWHFPAVGGYFFRNRPEMRTFAASFSGYDLN